MRGILLVAMANGDATDLEPPRRQFQLDDLKFLHAAAVNQYQSVNRILWTVFSIFFAAHAVLIGAVAQRWNDSGGILMMLSGIGAITAFAWTLLILRTIGHLRWHEEHVTRIEEDLGIGRPYRMFPARIAKGEFGHYQDTNALPLRYGPPAKIFMQVCTWATFVAWLLALAYFADDFD
jgi:hypothetical protein